MPIVSEMRDIGEGIAQGDFSKAALNGAMLGMYGAQGASGSSKLGVRQMTGSAAKVFALGGASHAVKSAYTRGFASGAF